MSEHTYQTWGICSGVFVDTRDASDSGHQQILSIVFLVEADHARHTQFVVQPRHGGFFGAKIRFLWRSERISDFEEQTLLARVSK